MVRYKQKTGKLFGPDGSYWVTGYSGKDPGKNDPNYQRVVGVGPIPQGTYTIGEPHDSPNTGPYTMNLTPQVWTDTFGRSEFRIHGDSKTNPGGASHGCVIVPRAWRERIWAENADRLLVVESGS